MGLFDSINKKESRHKADFNRLIKDLNAKKAKTRKQAVLTLSEAGIPAIRPILHLLITTPDRDLQKRAGSVITHMGEQAVLPLSAAMHSEDPRIRKGAALALGYAGRTAVPYLIRALKDSNRETREEAARSIGYIGWDDWKQDQTEEKVLCLIIAGNFRELARMKSTGLPALIDLLGHGDYVIQTRALHAIGLTGDITALPYLIRMRDDGDPGIRGAVMEALGGIGGHKAEMVLRKALRDPAPGVRVEAAWALDKTGWKPQNTAEKVFFLMAKEQWNELSRMGTEVIPYLLASLREKEGGVRHKAAGTLRDMGPTGEKALEYLKTEGKDKRIRELASDALTMISEDESAPPLGEEGMDITETEDTSYHNETPEEKAARLAKPLGDSDKQIRIAAVEALRQVGDAASGYLIRTLGDEDTAIRAAAAEALGEIGNPQAVPVLIRMLRDDDSEIRMASATALGGIRDTFSINPLIRLFEDEDEGVRSAAALALADMEISVMIPALMEASESENKVICISVAEALGNINDPEVITPLITLLNDSNEDVRESAVRAFAHPGNLVTEKITALVSLLEDRQDRNRRLLALDALGEITDERAGLFILRAADDPDRAVSEKAVDVLDHRQRMRPGNGREEKEIISRLIRDLGSDESDQRTEARRRLVRAGRPATDQLTDALERANPTLRKEITGVLTAMGESVLDEIIRATGDRNRSDQTRIALMAVLSRFPHRRTAEATGRILSGDENTGIRMAAAEALGEMGGPHIVDALSNALTDRERDVRMMAVEILAASGQKGAVNPLIRTIKEETDISEPAAEALARLGRVAVGPLLRELRMGSQEWRLKVARILENIGWEPATGTDRLYYQIATGNFEDVRSLDPILDAIRSCDDDIRTAATEALGDMGHLAVSLLVPVLNSGKNRDRARAAEALGYAGEEAIPPLIGALSDRSSGVRAKAAGGLETAGWKPVNQKEKALIYIANGEFKKLRDCRGAGSMLTSLLSDTDSRVRASAVRALDLREDGITELISGLLEDPSPDVRREAAEALEKQGGIPIDDLMRVRWLIAAGREEEIISMGEKAVPSLIQALTCGSILLRLFVTGTLAEMGGCAIHGLQEAEMSTEPEIRTAAAEALSVIRGRTPDQADALPPQSDPWERLGIDLKKLRGTPEEKVALIAPSLQNPDRGIRSAAVEALRLIGDPAVDYLIKTLEDEHSEVRAASAEALGALKIRSALPFLITGTGDPEGEVRAASARALGEIREISAVSLLLKLFTDDGSKEVREAAAEALGALIPHSLRPLLEIMNQGDETLSTMAILALGRSDEPVVVRYLIMGLNRDEGPIQSAASDALASIHTRGILSLTGIFTEMLTSGTHNERLGVLGILSRDRGSSEELIRLAQEDPDPEISSYASEILNRSEKEPGSESDDIMELIRLLAGGEGDGSAVIRRIQALGRSAAEGLLLALDDEEPAIREAAAGMIADMRNTIQQELADTLQDRQQTQAARLTAAVNLGRITNRRSSKALGWALYDPEPEIRLVAAETLGFVGDSDSVEALIHVLDDTETEVRAMATRSLGRLKDSRATGPLITLLNSADIEISETAAEALRNIGSPARALLVKALTGGNREFRLRVAECLDALGGQPMDPGERACYLIARGDWYELEVMGEVALEPLSIALHDSDEEMRLGAVNALTKISGSKAAELLITVLDDRSGITSSRASRGLTGMGEVAREPLRLAMAESEGQKMRIIQRILERMGPEPEKDPDEQGQ